MNGGTANTTIRNFAMNIKRLAIKSLAPAILALGALAFVACENPFRAGLGPLVDLRDPTIGLARAAGRMSPNNGESIQDTVTFHGDVNDDIRILGAWFRV
ncbi:MAG: hypothetical protein FWD88_03735, partial [Treponema sp.]|nr:hypothetical protein [Treponema sp.]